MLKRSKKVFNVERGEWEYREGKILTSKTKHKLFPQVSK